MKPSPRVRPLAFLLIGASALGLGLPGLSGQGVASFSLGGSVEARPFVSYSGPADLSGSFAVGSAVGTDIELAARGPSAALRASAGLSFEATVLSGAAARTAWLASGLGLAPADSLLLPATAPAPGGSETALAARLRTGWAKLDLGWTALTLGRQVLNYGRAPYWSPEDIFASLDLTGISPTRRGSDALRLSSPFGETGLIEAVATLRADPALGSYALKLSGLPLSGLELSTLAGHAGAATGNLAGDEYFAGGDFKLDLGPAFYGEVLGLFPGDGEAAVVRASGGLDWSFEDLMVALEYYWNGGLASTLDPYGAGAHNLYAALSWKAGDYATLAATLAWDLTDERPRLSLLASIDAAQNAALGLYARLGRGASAQPAWTGDAGLDLLVKF